MLELFPAPERPKRLYERGQAGCERAERGQGLRREWIHLAVGSVCLGAGHQTTQMNRNLAKNTCSNVTIARTRQELA